MPAIRPILISLCLLSALASFCRAQESARFGPAQRSLVPELGSASGTSFRPPANPLLSKRSLALLGLFGSAALLTTENRDPQLIARRLDGDGLLDGFIDVGDAFGDGRTLGALTVGSYLYGQWADSERANALSADLTRSLLTTWAAVWVLKLSVSAERPNGGSHSFPSGHTATAFAGATVLRRHFGGKTGLALFLLSVGTGLARMEDRKHHPADVLFGAALGMTLGQEAITGHRGRFAFDGFTFSSRSLGVQFRF